MSQTQLQASRAMLHLVAAAHAPVPEPLAQAMMELVARCAAEVDAEQRGTVRPGWADRLRIAVAEVARIGDEAGYPRDGWSRPASSDKNPARKCAGAEATTDGTMAIGGSGR